MTIPLPLVSQPLKRFLATEAGSAALLLTAAIVALVWANLPGGDYEGFWHTQGLIRVGDAELSLDLRHWVNDGAMVLFFFAVGLEINRELTVGELHNPRAVVVPVAGALGGLILPAVIYLMFNAGGPGAHGWGVPISTDTAFVIGILALFGPRCPDQLRLFLLTLAIADDIGAIAVLAIFYSSGISMLAVVIVGVLTLLLIGMRWAGVWQVWLYLIVGIALWAAVFASGLHPTLAGVLIGLIVPAKPVDQEQIERLRYYGRALFERADATRARLVVSATRATVPPNDRLQEALHPISAFVVVPVFGLANAGVVIREDTLRTAATSPVTLGVIAALVAGKAIGISGAAALALRTGRGDLPGRVRYGHLMGGAVLAGIGFTIALFIADLAFDDPVLRDQAKLGVLTGSLLAAIIGSVVLRYLGERLPLCSADDGGGEIPPLPSGPWRDPTLRS